MLATIVCEQWYVKSQSVYQTHMHMHMFLPVGRIDPMKDPDASCLSGLSGVTIASRET
jgi:hypothetical protein